MAESNEELKSLLMKVKEEGEKKNSWKINIQKTNIIADGGENGNWQILFYWVSKLLWMVTAAMKLKDGCPLEEKLWQA